MPMLESRRAAVAPSRMLPVTSVVRCSLQRSSGAAVRSQISEARHRIGERLDRSSGVDVRRTTGTVMIDRPSSACGRKSPAPRGPRLAAEHRCRDVYVGVAHRQVFRLYRNSAHVFADVAGRRPILISGRGQTSLRPMSGVMIGRRSGARLRGGGTNWRTILGLRSSPASSARRARRRARRHGNGCSQSGDSTTADAARSVGSSSLRRPAGAAARRTVDRPLPCPSCTERLARACGRRGDKRRRNEKYW